MAGRRGEAAAPSARPREELTGQALRRLVLVLPHVRLEHVPKRFPHLMNRIAAAWPHRQQTLALFDELLFLDRGRMGFPIQAFMELQDLRAFYEGRYLDKPTGWSVAEGNRDLKAHPRR